MRIRLVLISLLIILSVNSLKGKDLLLFNVKQIGNWVYYGTERGLLEFKVTNSSEHFMPLNLGCKVINSKNREVYNLSQRTVVLDSAIIDFGFNFPAAGFYNVEVRESKKTIESFTIGYEPEKIEPNIISPDNFYQFWELAKLELKDYLPNFKMVRDKGLSTRERNVYNVSFTSYGGERVSGVWIVPKRGRNFSTILTLIGAEDVIDIVSMVKEKSGDKTNHAEFIFKLYGEKERRGEYKGLFLDMVRVVDFICSREVVNEEEIFVEGHNYGAGAAIIAASLDNRIKGVAVASINFSQEAGLYSPLSFAQRLKSPLLLVVGLQDKSCSPTDNFRMYNSISSAKEYYIFPDLGDALPLNWLTLRDEFFKKISD